MVQAALVDVGCCALTRARPRRSHSGTAGGTAMSTTVNVAEMSYSADTRERVRAAGVVGAGGRRFSRSRQTGKRR